MRFPSSKSQSQFEFLFHVCFVCGKFCDERIIKENSSDLHNADKRIQIMVIKLLSCIFAIYKLEFLRLPELCCADFVLFSNNKHRLLLGFALDLEPDQRFQASMSARPERWLLVAGCWLPQSRQ